MTKYFDENGNPTTKAKYNAPIDVAFRVEKPTQEITEKTAYAKHSTGKFGIKTKHGGFFKSAKAGLKKVDAAAQKATNKAVAAGYKGLLAQKEARNVIHQARTTHLRRKQEISEYRTNILNLKHQKQIHKSNILSAKLSQNEQKKALAESRATGRTKKRYRGLSDSFVPKQKKSNGGFFAGAANLNKPRKKGGFFS